MIIYAKESRLNKVDQSFFKIVSVSAEAIDDSIFNMVELYPPADHMIKVSNGGGKKKFLDKYRKFLKTKDTNVEYSIFSLGMALRANQNICLTTTDKEFKLGYLKILAKYISRLYGVEVKEIKDVNEEIKYELEGYSKKERKIIKKDDDDLSKKQRKFKRKVTKSVLKSINDGFGGEGLDNYEKTDRKFAIDQLAMVLLKSEAIEIGKDNKFKNIDTSKIPKSKPYIEAIFIASNESKAVRRVVKSTLDSHDIKFKKKALKKFDKTTIISLFGEIYSNILALRNGEQE